MLWLTVHIGGQKWRVYLVKKTNKNLQSEHGQLDGITIPEKCRIYVSRDLDDQAREDTLLHELLHAVFVVSGAENVLHDECGESAHKAEEQIIRCMVPTLHRLLKDLSFRFPKAKQ